MQVVTHQKPVKEIEEIKESQIAAVLESRYGEGLLYLPKNSSTAIFSKAVERGYVDDEGYLTRRGRALLTRYRYR